MGRGAAVCIATAGVQVEVLEVTDQENSLAGASGVKNNSSGPQ